MFERILNKMLNVKTSLSLFKRYFFRLFLNLKLLVNFYKIYFLIFTLFFVILFIESKNNLANNDYSKIKIYVEDSKGLKSKKRNSRLESSKYNSQELEYFFKKTSETLSRKGKNKQAADKMKETSVTTKNMVKNNRWFVKKPFKKSYNKISSIKRVTPPKVDTGEFKDISIMASKLTKDRARETGSTKPEIIFSRDSSRSAQKMTTSLTQEAGPPKSGTVYTEDSSRIAMDISKTKARDSGPVKPKVIYSDEVSREAYKITSKRNKKKLRLKPTYTGQRYSVEFLKSLSRKPTIKKETVNKTSKALEKK